MTARLRPLREDEYDDWYAAARDGYATDIERNAGLPREVAREKATRDLAQILADRLATPGHVVFAVEADGDTVGALWLADRTVESGRSLFVYELRIDEAHRGRGYGRAAMALAEEEARSRGIDRIALNVLGGNAVARGLYRSLGYREVAVFMEKDV